VTSRERSIDTSRGPARAVVSRPPRPAEPIGLAILLHGAGTDTSAAPLPVMAEALTAAGVVAVRFDQPYRVAGRRSPDPAHLLDRALLEALPQLRRYGPGLPLVFAGRSSGARVACRCAEQADARAVACLGFPWRPPQGRSAEPRPDRGGELRAAAARVPVLVLQGERDPFGMPRRGRNVTLRRFPAVAHIPTEAMAMAATSWLVERLQGTRQEVGAFPRR